MQSALNLLHEQPQKRTQTVKLKNSGTQTTVTQHLTSARDWAQLQADAWEARAGELEVKYQEAIRPKGLVHWLRTRLGL